MSENLLAMLADTTIKPPGNNYTVDNLYTCILGLNLFDIVYLINGSVMLHLTHAYTVMIIK